MAEDQEQVRAADGHVYSRKAIEEWFETHDTSPMTNRPMANKLLTPVGVAEAESAKPSTTAGGSERGRIVEEPFKWIPPSVLRSLGQRVARLEMTLSGNVKGHGKQSTRRQPKQTKKNFKQQKRHQNIKNATINKAAAAAGLSKEGWQACLFQTYGLVHEWVALCRALCNTHGDSTAPPPGSPELLLLASLPRDEQKRMRKAADGLFGLVQHCLQSGPMKHSKPCDFRRCSVTAETLALVLHFLQRVLALVAPVDAEREPLLTDEDPTRLLSDPPGCFTLRQIGTLQGWAGAARQFVDAQLGLVAVKRGQAPKADPAFEQAWPLERSGSEKRWTSRHKRAKASAKKSVKLAGALKDELLSAAVDAAARTAALKGLEEAESPISPDSRNAQTPGTCLTKTLVEPVVNTTEAKKEGSGLRSSDDRSNDDEEEEEKEEEEAKPRRAHAGNIAFGGHGEEWENTEPKARISNNKLLRAKREQAALQAKLESAPRRLMSGKAKKALLKARRQVQRDVAAGGEKMNNAEPCTLSGGEAAAAAATTTTAAAAAAPTDGHPESTAQLNLLPAPQLL